MQIRSLQFVEESFQPIIWWSQWKKKQHFKKKRENLQKQMRANSERTVCKHKLIIFAQIESVWMDFLGKKTSTKQKLNTNDSRSQYKVVILIR